jgi:hypothetical protein
MRGVWLLLLLFLLLLLVSLSVCWSPVDGQRLVAVLTQAWPAAAAATVQLTQLLHPYNPRPSTKKHSRQVVAGGAPELRLAAAESKVPLERKWAFSEAGTGEKRTAAGT